MATRLKNWIGRAVYERSEYTLRGQWEDHFRMKEENLIAGQSQSMHSLMASHHERQQTQKLNTSERAHPLPQLSIFFFKPKPTGQ